MELRSYTLVSLPLLVHFQDRGGTSLEFDSTRVIHYYIGHLHNYRRRPDISLKKLEITRPECLGWAPLEWFK